MMKNEIIRQTESGFHVEGYPDAIKLVRLDGHKARQVAHYALHRSDFQFALHCLDSINAAANPVMQEALWQSAIVHFIKCFKGASARTTSLDRRVIFKHNAPALAAFKYFDDLRDKHTIHDENSYTQSIPCAAINGGGKAYKVERIFALSLTGVTLEQSNFNNLHLLVTQALSWLESKFNDMCDDLTKDLEREPLETLLARDQVTSTAPQLSEIGERRKGF